MAATFVTALIEFEPLGNLGAGLEIGDGLRLLSDSSRVGALRDKTFRSLIGELEYAQLCEAKGLVTLENISMTPVQFASGPAYIACYLSLISRFLQCLWLIKDHSIGFELGFLHSPDQGTHSNLLTQRPSLASGRSRRTSFSKSDLTAAKQLFRSLQGKKPITQMMSGATKEITDSVYSPTLLSSKESHCFERFWGFVAFARNASDLGVKAVMYATALETLFSTSSSEMTRKVSERVAIFIGFNGISKREVFHRIKRLYSLRSSVVHGSIAAKNIQSEVEMLTAFADAVVRQCGVKMLSNEDIFKVLSEGGGAVDDYFTTLLFP